MYFQPDLVAALRSIPWFLELKPAQLERLAKIADLCQIKANEELFLEGGKEDYLYILMEGQVALEMRVPSHGKVRIFTAEPLDIIGWSSLTPVARQRTASARATAPSRLIQLDAEALFHFCEEDRDLGYVIMRRLANVIASRLLTTRLALIDLLVYQGQRYPTSTTILE